MEFNPGARSQWQTKTNIKADEKRRFVGVFFQVFCFNGLEYDVTASLVQIIC